MLRRIRVSYRLRAEGTDREQIERVHAAHAASCPVARSLQGAIAISTELDDR